MNSKTYEKKLYPTYDSIVIAVKVVDDKSVAAWSYVPNGNGGLRDESRTQRYVGLSVEELKELGFKYQQPETYIR